MADEGAIQRKHERLAAETARYGSAGDPIYRLVDSVSTRLKVD
jgi:hypothetical protein